MIGKNEEKQALSVIPGKWGIKPYATRDPGYILTKYLLMELFDDLDSRVVAREWRNQRGNAYFCTSVRPLSAFWNSSRASGSIAACTRGSVNLSHFLRTNTHCAPRSAVFSVPSIADLSSGSRASYVIRRYLLRQTERLSCLREILIAIRKKLERVSETIVSVQRRQKKGLHRLKTLSTS